MQGAKARISSKSRNKSAGNRTKSFHKVVGICVWCVASKIATAGAVGDNGVGNVDGAGVIYTAAAAVGCIIPRKCGIGDCSDSGSGTENAAAAVGSSIACDSGIGDGKGALVKNTATAIVSSIACDGGVGDSDVTTRIRIRITVVDASAIGGSRISGKG